MKRGRRMIELKPCPFCKSKAVAVSMGRIAEIGCINPNCDFTIHSNNGMNDATEKWNRLEAKE